MNTNPSLLNVDVAQKKQMPAKTEFFATFLNHQANMNIIGKTSTNKISSK